MTIATGRLLASTLYLARKIDIDLPLICNDGVQIHDLREGKDIYFDPIPPATAEKIFSILREYPVKLQFFLRDKKFYFGQQYRPELLKRYLRVSKYNPVSLWNYLRDFYFIPHQVIPASASSITDYLREEGPAKISFNGREEHIKEIREFLQKEIADKLDFTSGVPGWIDIMKKGNSKGEAVKLLAGMYGIDRKEIIAAGDNYNDLEMLEFAGLGIAINSAPQAVKDAADITVGCPDNNGLAEFLEIQVLERGA